MKLVSTIIALPILAGCSHLRTVRVVSPEGAPIPRALVVGEDRTKLSWRKQKSVITETDQAGYATLALAQFAEIAAGKEGSGPVREAHSLKSGHSLQLVLPSSSNAAQGFKSVPTPDHAKIGDPALWERWRIYIQTVQKAAHRTLEPHAGP